MLDSLVNVISGAWWSYPLIAFLAAFDVILPVLPSETAVVTGGIVAAHGGLLLPLVLIIAAVGAFAGDNLAYWIGRKGQRVARRWLLRGDKGQKLITWAARLLDQYGGSVLIVGRFVPGGRTAIAVGAGIVSFPWRRFALYDAVGAVTWATVNSVIGYVGGKAFERQTWLAFVVSFAAAILVGAVVELVRRVAGRRHTGRGDAAAAGPDPPAPGTAPPRAR
jgi:membrane protein DedA with SNARE-associated domain